MGQKTLWIKINCSKPSGTKSRKSCSTTAGRPGVFSSYVIPYSVENYGFFVIDCDWLQTFVRFLTGFVCLWHCIMIRNDNRQCNGKWYKVLQSKKIGSGLKASCLELWDFFEKFFGVFSIRFLSSKRAPRVLIKTPANILWCLLLNVTAADFVLT